MTTTNHKPENIGAINPYALAEVILKKRVNWKRIRNPQKLLEDTLGHPYEKLFDPIHDSPLYVGRVFDKETKMMTRTDLAPKVEGVVHAAVEANATAWVDVGDFFEEGTEMTDPVQGALGDCYFIAALSSVAWARPYIIAQRNRATGAGQQQFVDMVEFFSGGKWIKVEVTELLPVVTPGNNLIYARSSETGEIWPGVYEKAFAKWRTNHTGDQPQYDPIAGGDPVAALQQLTGLTTVYVDNASVTTDQIWQKILGNCFNKKTFNPMVAFTYNSAAEAPTPINYDNAHIAACHAYSILGWSQVNNQNYIVLRNPWGTYEATLNVTGGTWTAWDQPYNGGSGFWRSIPMATDEGIFALRVDTFKNYFAGFGWVK
jgi:hypothetical protein